MEFSTRIQLEDETEELTEVKLAETQEGKLDKKLEELAEKRKLDYIGFLSHKFWLK